MTPPLTTRRPRLRPAASAAATTTAAAVVAATALLVAPPVASADTYLVSGPAEVVDRTDGAQGAAALHHTGLRIPGAISGDGRWSAFAVAEGAPGDPGYHQSLVLRDIRDNRTYEVVHAGTSTPTSIDRRDRLVAFTSDQRVTSDDTDSTSDLFLVDLTNGRTALVGRASGAGGAPGTATGGLVSGDGDSVVFSGTVPGLGTGVFRRDLLTRPRRGSPRPCCRASASAP